MKKSVLLIIISAITFGFSAVFAESWDDYSGLDRLWDGQKSITNKEFEDVMNVLEEKKNKKSAKQKKKQIKKIGGGGTSLHNELNPDKEIKELAPLKKNEEEHLLNIPVNIIADETPLEKGFYRVIGEKDKDGNIYLMFYQSQFLKGKIKAIETNDDYDENNLNFVKLIPYNDDFVQILFGSLDFNAYAFVRFIQD